MFVDFDFDAIVDEPYKKPRQEETVSSAPVVCSFAYGAPQI